MPDVQCFLIEPTTSYEVYARRYTDTTKHPERSGCPSYGHHSAQELQATIDLYQGESLPMLEVPSSGPPTEHEMGVFHWPEKCERCPYVFQEDDVYQRFLERQYKRPDLPELKGLRYWPPGAVYRASWFEGRDSAWSGPDGQCWAVRLPIPDMVWDWIIDGPATGGGRWTRTGVAPRFTVTPSIGAGDPRLYHGWLRDGVLVED